MCIRANHEWLNEWITISPWFIRFHQNTYFVILCHAHTWKPRIKLVYLEIYRRSLVCLFRYTRMAQSNRPLLCSPEARWGDKSKWAHCRQKAYAYIYSIVNWSIDPERIAEDAIFWPSFFFFYIRSRKSSHAHRQPFWKNQKRRHFNVQLSPVKR